MTPPTCETCRYWAGLPGVGAVAGCRRHAPTVDPWGTAAWPTTHPRDWCGDHDPREPTVYEFLQAQLRGVYPNGSEP